MLRTISVSKTISSKLKANNGLVNTLPTRKVLCSSIIVLLAACGGGSGTAIAQTTTTSPVTSVNLALNKAVTSSSVQATTWPATAAVDGNVSSRWSSGWSDTEWIKVDLGSAKTINHVGLNWEAAYGKAYQIQTSTDGSTWTTVYNTTTGVGGAEDIRFNAVSARYVKMNGVKRATAWGYSLFEFTVYNDPPQNLALKKLVTASSIQDASLPAAAAVDGNVASRWSSAWTDNEWISVDLGAATTVSHILLNWEAAYAKSYQIQTSTDGSSWATPYSTTAGVGGKEDIKFNAVKARYVKMKGIKRATVWGYSLFEFIVYNDGVAPVTPPSPSPSPTPTPTPPPPPPPAPTGTGTVGPTITSFIATGPVTLSSGQVLTGRHISNPNGPCIQGSGVSNVHIYNNKIGPCGPGADDAGILINGAHDITVDHNSFDDVSGGLYAINSTNNIVFDHNYATRIRGPYPRGQIVQFNGVVGSGNKITCNISDQTTPGYKDGTEDHINTWLSSGTAASPMLIQYNKLRGGGPSDSGGGIVAGDGGGSYITVDTNILVNPGQYGVAIAGGHDNKLLNNKVYSTAFAWSNIGAFVWNQYAPTANNETVSGNRVNWINKDGAANNWWDGGNAGTITMSNNVFGDPSIGASIWNETFPQCGG
jgi:hypothetical protein